MISNNTDKEWEKLGKDQPYFGVITDEAYAKENMTAEAAARFFESGESYIQMIFDHIRAHVHAEFKPESAVDLGCGVGRLAIPLASRCANVTGIDVSPSMLKEAGKNCRERNIGNVQFAESLDALPTGTRFDFVNSFIVLQHIPTDRGLAIFRGLLDRLAPGGCGALHLTYRESLSPLGAVVSTLKKRFQPVNYLMNLAKGRPMTTPHMQMNGYDMNIVQWELQKLGCQEFLSLFTHHAKTAGQILLFRKPLTRVGLKA